MGFEFLAGKKHFSCFLVTIQTPDGVFYRIVDEKSFTVGRSSDSALSFPEPNISRIHIVVSCKKDQIWLIDQGSANGTFINGQKVLPNKLTVVQPTDDVKLGTSEIHLKFDVFEKAYKPDAVINSLLPENEKTSIMEVIQGAHQQAKRIIMQSQEHYDKLIKSAEVKVRNVENSLLVKQDEIVQAANVQASQMLQEAKKKSAQVVFDSEQKALEATKDIFSRAEDLKNKAETFYNEKIAEAQEKADAMISNHVEMGQQMLHQASVKAQEIKSQMQEDGESLKQRLISEGDAHRQKALVDAEAIKQKAAIEGEKLKEKLLERAKIELTGELSDLKREIVTTQNELTVLRQAREKDFEAEAAQKRRELEISLSGLRNEIEKSKQDHSDLVIKQEKEFELSLKKKSLEVDRLNQEKEGELKKRTEAISFEIAKQEKELERLAEMRERELKKRQNDLDQQYQNHLHEIEKTVAEKENAMRLRVDLDLVDKKREIHQFEGEALAYRKELEQVRQTIQQTQDERDQEMRKLSDLRKDVEKTRVEKSAVEDSHQGLLKVIQQFDQEKKLAHDRVKDLESRAGHLQLVIEEGNNKLESLNTNYQVKVQEYKLKLDSEFAQLKKEKEQQFRDAFNAESENAKVMRHQLQQEIQSKQGLIESNIHQKIMKTLAGHVGAEKLGAIDALTLSQIKAGFEENLATTATQNQAGQLNTVEMHRKQQLVKVRWVSLGLAIGFFTMFGYNFISSRLDNKNLQKVLAAEQAERDRLRKAARYNPEQDYEVRDNYADSVIYTKDFSTLYEDPQVQERWVREAKDYFFKNWRVDEQKTIELLAAAKTLVKTLDEKRQNIHPDFVTENLQKMRELEDESVLKMKEIIGTDVKFSAFKKIEKKFYTNEITRRAPAEVYIDPNVEGTK
jgi:pSer/pThr/pTyr-binding forkhead associated (FHA) protein